VIASASTAIAETLILVCQNEADSFLVEVDYSNRTVREEGTKEHPAPVTITKAQISDRFIVWHRAGNYRSQIDRKTGTFYLDRGNGFIAWSRIVCSRHTGGGF
jgi:hypothetical protein